MCTLFVYMNTLVLQSIRPYTYNQNKNKEILSSSRRKSFGLQLSQYVWSKENWIEGGGDRVSVHFAITFLDYWRTGFCVTKIIKIVNNNTNDKQTSGISGALGEESPYTNSCLFTLDRLPLLLLYGNPLRLFNSPCVWLF